MINQYYKNIRLFLYLSPLPKKSFGKFLIGVLFTFLGFGTSFIPSTVFAQPTVNFSYSYINVTRNSGGGTLEPGDIIEVHALANLPSGNAISNVYFIAPITAGTQYVPNSLKLITNEGVPLLTYTDGSADDQGVYDASKPAVRINIGTSSPYGGTAYSGASFYSTSGGGIITGGDVPKGGGGTMGIMAYRLLITGSFGDIINPTGTFYYSYTGGSKSHPTTINTSYNFNYSGIKIVQNQGLCANFSSTSFTAESSFGSGTTQNRAAGVNAPGYTKVNLAANAPGDNYYAVANNTSANGSTNNGVPYAPASSPTRVFGGYWDIIGDHTNATNPAAGNLPVPPGTNGGYMLVVNASITTGEAYKDVIQNLCPNTYYEFSAWIRNLCGKCGQDMNGVQTYQPGVKPNLTYAINNIDYYSTGDITYSNTWVKRGFIYKTGPAETSFTITIKNNASGGGGNDWVLDDINLATCYPNLIMNPNDTAKVCAGYAVTITDTVKSYYNNYGNYQWEASSDGTTWFPIIVSGGTINPGNDPHTVTPVLVNGLYQYYVDASFIPSAAYNGYYFRLKVATTTSNLTNASCSVDKSQRVYMKVYTGNCSVLNSQVLDFSGNVRNGKNVLQWNVPDNNNVSEYEIEKSIDGIHFLKAGVVTQSMSSQRNTFSFTDPENTSNTTYYRLKVMGDNSSADSYSKTIVLYNKSSLFKISTVNPFSSLLKVSVCLPESGNLEMNLFDMYGKCLIKKSFQLGSGNSEVDFGNVANLPAGMYILNAFHNGMNIQSKLIKSN